MRGATFASLISDLRDELRRANTPSASPDDEGSLRRTINRVYRTLYLKHDWDHLKKLFPKITLNAGQRYYDVPTGLEFDRILEAKVWWNGSALPVERGIEFSDYEVYNPELNERTAPIVKWDVRWMTTKEQLEVWPLPDTTAQYFQFHGLQRIDPLVSATDKCLLDSDMVVAFAAAELLKAQKSDDADAKLQMANELYRTLTIRAGAAGGKSYQIGVGSGEEGRRPRAEVRISG